MFEPHPFWDFSLDAYTKPSVADACLHLQERVGANANLLLFCLWWNDRPRPELSPDSFRKVAEAATLWQRKVVSSVRAARRNAKSGATGLDAAETKALYKSVLATELDCEHAEQLIIARTAESLTGGAPVSMEISDVAVGRDVGRYLGTLDAELTEADWLALARLIEVCCSRPQDALGAIRDILLASGATHRDA